MYHVLIESQTIKRSNDMSKIKMVKRIHLKISREFACFPHIFGPAISHLIICFNE